MSSRDARKAGRTAAGLERLPKTREALERGEIGVGQAEALASRMDKPEQARNVADNEDDLLEKAKSQDVDEFARTMRQEDITGSPDRGNTHGQRQRHSRKASMWIDDETGMHLLFAEFDPVTGARISTQLAATVDQLWRAEHLPGVARRSKRLVAQRRADALEALICRNNTKQNASTTGTTSPAGDTSPTGDAAGPTPQPAAPDDSAVPAPNPTQLMVIANYDALRQALAGGSLPDGTPLPAEAVATLACDAELLPAIFSTTGQPLWLGRTQRLATPAQRAAVAARDRGCIACGTAAEWCQVHHITWWSQHGTTDLDNLCLLCSKHHHLVHEHNLKIVTTADGPKIHTGPTRTTGPPSRQPTHQRGSPAAA